MSAIDVWIVRLDLEDAELGRLYGLLSADERERAGDLPLTPRKRRYVARQGAVREILGRYAGTPPTQLRLVRSAAGKPRIDQAGAPCFSVSDSGDVALLAIASHEVGVDVERVVRRRAVRGAGRRERERFFRSWTRREATGKALGTGLRRRPGDAAGLVCMPLEVGRGYAAALAAPAAELSVRVRTG
jgi:4'-phosphopantetheinyl transferase